MGGLAGHGPRCKGVTITRARMGNDHPRALGGLDLMTRSDHHTGARMGSDHPRAKDKQ